MTASASNIANALTAGSLTDENNAPYTALTTVSKAQGSETGGVQTQIVAKNPGYVTAYAPGSPFADENGLVGAPNVDFAEEIVKLKLAEISYKANIGTIKTAAELEDDLLSILDKKV
ncbi:MAG: flagellar biosynthesis protein FlgC [Alphaproteobacteria bacterium]|nr:flagellar biosynthesis protein FlgC [Alphaproteobacteria bacterium]